MVRYHKLPPDHDARNASYRAWLDEVLAARRTENMTYETAPATLLVATECACCARPLVDSYSVEVGVGPDCRKRHGFGAPDVVIDPASIVTALAAAGLSSEELFDVCPDANAPDLARLTANRLLHRIALDQVGLRPARFTAALHGLGFHKMAARIAKRIGVITVTVEGDQLAVAAPFNEQFNAEMRALRIAQWVKERKVRLLPKTARAALWGALKKCFAPGTIVLGERVAMLHA